MSMMSAMLPWVYIPQTQSCPLSVFCTRIRVYCGLFVGCGWCSMNLHRINPSGYAKMGRVCIMDHPVNFWWLSNFLLVARQLDSRRSSVSLRELEIVSFTTSILLKNSLTRNFYRDLSLSKCIWCTSLTQKEKEYTLWRWDEIRPRGCRAKQMLRILLLSGDDVISRSRSYILPFISDWSLWQ